jgi:hypothetical protein
MVRTFITALLVAACLGWPAPRVSAQILPQTGADLRALETRLRDRFQVLPIANGVVLAPKFRSTVRAIEVTDRAIAVDGMAVTGPELRDKLGADAELIFQLSYLDPVSRRSLLGVNSGGAPSPALPATPAPPAVSAPPSPPGAGSNPPRTVRRDDIVRFGGDVTIGADEVVSGDVAVIGGSADINGEVDGEVAVIGGSLTLGPQADIKRDVTVVGGKLNKDPAAVIEGKLSEVGVGDAIRGARVTRRTTPYHLPWTGGPNINPVFGFGGTIVRLALMMLLAGIVLLVARVPVQHIADRAAAEPLKSWAIGFLAEILFVPVLVLIIVVLAVSIIGIPLLVLVPVAIVAALLVSLVGFTGVAYHLGRLIEGRFDQLRDRPYLATFVGITVIMSPLLLARLIGMVSGLGVIVGILIAAGIVLEYVAWTAGLGAAALVRFGKPQPPPQPPAAQGFGSIAPPV